MAVYTNDSQVQTNFKLPCIGLLTILADADPLYLLKGELALYNDLLQFSSSLALERHTATQPAHTTELRRVLNGTLDIPMNWYVPYKL